MSIISFTAADLEPLKQALLTGAVSITSEGRTITFRSQDEIIKLISDIEAQIAADENPTATPINPNKVKASFKK